MNIRQTTRQLLRTMILAVAGVLTAALVSESGLAQNKGPYLGQDPPGMTPELFGPGIVSTDAHEFSISMNPEATEIYFSRGEGPNNTKKIMVTRLERDGWTTPAPLFPDFPEQFEPGVTPDGQHLQFIAFHVTEGQSRPGLDMYRADRDGKNWGKPYHLGAPFNPSHSMYCSFTNDGTVYTTDPQTGGLDIARTKPTKDGFGPYENLGKPINTDGPEMYPFVAPDESYLLFCSMIEGRQVIMASFRMEDGTWSQPKEVPLGMNAGVPFVSRDGKYFFFTAGKMPSDIYWVDFEIVRKLKPTGK